ncbi:L-isoaspartyl protein carboxyl methyltransferase, partial [Candidatus Campbellbacteria bacterium CG22_combo_CG10-13_8_21_14_all_43_18]
PLPIGEGQTISQPTVVAFMLELLELEEGQKVLDVGSGSGWTTALIRDIVGPSGEVYGLERQPNLVEFGRANLGKFNFRKAEIFQAKEGVLGYPERGPYDRILVSAAYDEIPQELIKQLKAGGIMVAPVRDSILKISKKSEDEIEKEGFQGFYFVPLIK